MNRISIEDILIRFKNNFTQDDFSNIFKVVQKEWPTYNFYNQPINDVAIFNYMTRLYGERFCRYNKQQMTDFITNKFIDLYPNFYTNLLAFQKNEVDLIVDRKYRAILQEYGKSGEDVLTFLRNNAFANTNSGSTATAQIQFDALKDSIYQKSFNVATNTDTTKYGSQVTTETFHIYRDILNITRNAFNFGLRQMCAKFNDLFTQISF